MKNRISFYISRKNWLTWVMAFFLTASAVARITLACMKGAGDRGSIWGLVVLPVAACLLYVLISLINGRERFYKTGIPVLLMALYFCFQTRADMPELSRRVVFLYGFMYFTLAIFYILVAGGKVRHYYVLLLAYLVPLGFRTVSYWNDLGVHFVMEGLWHQLPDTLYLIGMFFAVLAMQIHNDGKYHATWGDRPDGRRIRTLPPESQISPYIMVNRNGSSNLFSGSIEITNVERYIRAKRRDGMENFGLNHVLIAAYLRVICKYPGVNRFLAGQKVYSRGDDVQYCMTAKKEMSIDAPDTCFKLHLSRSDTSKEVYEKFSAAVEELRSTPLNSTFDDTARYMTLIPGVFLKFAVWLLKTLVYIGLLPRFLLEVSPFHGSVFFTSMGSLGIPAIYHHLYDFGNLPVFCAFGAKYRTNEVLADGTVVQRKYVDIKLTLDERIVDGYYYASMFKYFKRILAHPEILDEPPAEILEDIE